MRIRNRSLSFSAVSKPITVDLTATTETKREEEKEPKPEEEGKMHLDRGFSNKNQLYQSCGSSRPPENNRSPSRQDQLRQINGGICQLGCRNFTGVSSCMLSKQEEDRAASEEGEREEIWNASDKRSNNPSAQTVRLLLPSQAGARWSEGESSYPLKKRKRNYEFMLMASVDKTKRKKKKKKHTKEDSNDDDDDDDDRAKIVKKVNNNSNNSSNVVEGSRCSRVNGRGWRCSQATLVGYSLCEHHLGKGRLKSINNSNTNNNITLRRSSATAITISSSNKGNELSKQKQQFLSEQQGLQETEEEDDDDDEEEEEGEKNKKKMKKKAGGVVKARSINSLLSQLHQTAPNMLS